MLSALCGTIRSTLCSCGDNPDVPYMRNQVNVKRVEHCLKVSGVLASTDSIDNFEVENIGGGEGLLSEICRAKLTYNRRSTGELPNAPAKMIVKCTPTSFNIRLMGKLFRLFQTEVEFYNQNIPAKTNMAAAEVYFADYDARNGRCCIMMEDLAPDKPPPQVGGATVEQMIVIIRQLARLHATYRNKVRSSGVGEFIPLWDDPSFLLWKIANSEMKKNHNKMRAAVKKRYNLDFSSPELPHTSKMCDMYGENFEHFTTNRVPVEQGGTLDMTVMHGDARIENFFFNPFVVIDFQLSREAPGEQDIAYLIATSLPEETAREYEAALVNLYYDSMVSLGVNEGKAEGDAGFYSRLECFLGVQMHLHCYIMNLAISTKGEKDLMDLEAADLGTGNTKARDSVVCMTERSAQAMEAWATSAPFVHYADLNKGKKKGEQWDMPKLSAEEIRGLLPKSIVEYIDGAGDTEMDAKLRSMEKDSGIVIRPPTKTRGSRTTKPAQVSTPAAGNMNSASV